MTLRHWPLFFIAGALWGLLALLLGHRAFGPALWGGVLVSPLIGLLVGRLVQDRFGLYEGFRRALLALASLYLSATLFGLAIGITDWSRLRGGSRSAFGSLGDALLSVWWGVTVTGFFLFLWPLAYFTHWLIDWIAERQGLDR